MAVESVAQALNQLRTKADVNLEGAYAEPDVERGRERELLIMKGQLRMLAVMLNEMMMFGMED